MSRHWNPKDDVAQVREARVRHSWPAGATAGVVVIAACCIGVAVVLYQLAGPRDVFAP
jgi:hypothetical protein